MTKKLGLDMGRSSVKITGEAGSILFPSLAALPGGNSAELVSRSKKNRPMLVGIDGRELFVGHNAHRAGIQPLENFSMDQLTNATIEMRAILAGALTAYQRKFSLDFSEPLEVVAGLPYQLLDGDKKQVDKWNSQVKGWIGGSHEWKADGKDMSAKIVKVGLAPQAFGVQTDYVFGMDGNPIDEARAKVMKLENGAISIGSSTVETQVTWKDIDTRRYCGGKPIGVRWLKSVSDPHDRYYFGEWSELLQSDELPEQFNVTPYLDSWWTEVDRFLNEKWRGEEWQRFAKVFVVGGGSILLRDHLVEKFNGRAVFFDDPIMPISRGLYKAALRMKG